MNSAVAASQLPVDFDPARLAWDKQGGLLPAVVQDATNHRVLMLGYMNREALRITLESGRATFYSRSRKQLWCKGATSGHVLEVVEVYTDCDQDTLLLLARPLGPTCHLQRVSCFADAPANPFAELDALIGQRRSQRPEGSYTSRLFDSGVRAIAQKVGEEAVETALAAVSQDDAALLSEAADLLFHLQVLLCARGLGLADVARVLGQRRGG